MHDSMQPRLARRTLPPLLTALLLAGCGGGGGNGSGNGNGGGDDLGGGNGNGSSEHVVASLDLPGDGLGLLVSGNHAFAATGTAGLQSIDVSDPAAPAIVASIDEAATADFASGGMDTVAYGGMDILIASAGAEGAHAIDVTDPTSPAYSHTASMPGDVQDVATTPTGVFCVADGDVQVKDMPGLVDASVPTAGNTRGVVASGNYCFVTGGTSGGGGGSPELYVIDISDPASAHEEATLPLSGTPAGIEIIGDHAYVTAGNPGLFVIDISDPTSPTVAGETDPLSTTGPIAVDATRMRAYLGTSETASFPGGITIVDIANPAAPAVVGTIDLPDAVGGIDADNGTAHAVTFDPDGSNPGTLQVVDVSSF